MKAVLLALSVALSLTSCSAVRPPVLLSDPQLVRVPGPARYVPIDASLTEPTPDPTRPAPLCLDADGWPVLCDSQVAGWLEAQRGATASCNADKQVIRSMSDQEAGSGRD